MKDGACPKCGGKDIRTQQGSGSGISYRNVLPAALFRPVRLVNYACSSCGYLESYVVAEDVAWMRQKWARAGPDSSGD